MKIIQNGYTLIELLLVITVISIMSMLAIKTYHNHSETQRIDKAALEMQHILEAAIAYNVDFGQWPTANNITPACIFVNNNDIFLTDYLPNHTYQSNFGNHFCWSSQQSDNKGPLFWVALKTPAQIATRIAAELPNAIAVVNPNESSAHSCAKNSDACYVRAEVVQPSISNQKLKTQVVGMGYCNPNKHGKQKGSSNEIFCRQESRADHYTIQFGCPANNQAQVYIVPDFYQSAALPQAKPPTILTVLNATTKNNDSNPHHNTCKKKNSKSSKYICHVKVTALYDKGKHSVVRPRKGSPGTIGAFYIAYCVTTTTAKNKVTLW